MADAHPSPPHGTAPQSPSPADEGEDRGPPRTPHAASPLSLRPCPLAAETSESSPPLSPETATPGPVLDGQSAITPDLGHAGRVPPPAGCFTFSGSAPFVSPAALQYLQTIPAGQRWEDMIASYLRLEELQIPKGVGSIFIYSNRVVLIASHQSFTRLPTGSRPAEVGRWMKDRRYTTDHIPFVPDVRFYYDNWTAWWTLCQPAWRQGKGWPLPRDNTGTTNWGKVGARSQSGLFLVVMSTTWWALSIKSEEEWALFDDAMGDVQWVIDQVIDWIKAMPVPTSPQPSPPRKPGGFSGATWMSRSDGKRQPKPSRRLLEAA